MKFKITQLKLINEAKTFLSILLFFFSFNLIALEPNDSLSEPSLYLQGCINPQYPKVLNSSFTRKLQAGTLNVQSNGEILLDDNFFMPIDSGSIRASSALYLKNKEFIKEIKNGKINYQNNYFEFLNGAIEKNSNKITLSEGSAFIQERNLLMNYQSLSGALDKTLVFQNAKLSSCNDPLKGWEINAKEIVINNESSRGQIKNLSLKIFDTTILRLPYFPFPATTERLSGFLEPEISMTSDGLDLFLPYFWVLSSKSDLTIAPRIVNERGDGIESNLRYVTSASNSNFFDMLFFPKDKVFDEDYPSLNSERWAFKLKEKREVSNFYTKINWAKSSDAMIALDLPSSLAKIANQREHYLIQSLAAGINSKNFSLDISHQGHQSLNPFINTGYVKKPAINFQYSKQESFLNYFFNINYADFDIDQSNDYLFIDPNQQLTKGQRFIYEFGSEIHQKVKQLNISLITSLIYKDYELDEIKNKDHSKSIPSIQLKVSSLLKRSYEEKVSFINPELIYQKTKFRNQSKDPIFDLHPRNSSIIETYNNHYFFGDDRVPDTEALIGKLKWQLRHSNNRRYSLELIKRNELKPSQVLNSMMGYSIGKDNQVGTSLAFDDQNLGVFFNANYSQKRNEIVFGRGGIEINLPSIKISVSRNFQRNIPLLNLNNKLDYGEFSIEKIMPNGYKLLAGFSEDLDSSKTLDSYFGLGFENCCIAIKLYASDKRLSKYSFPQERIAEWNNENWEKMIAIENKSRINFEFELKGLMGSRDKINQFFSNKFINL